MLQENRSDPPHILRGQHIRRFPISPALTLRFINILGVINRLLHILPHLVLILGVGILPHHPQRLLEQVIHALNAPALRLWHTHPDEARAEVGEHREEKEDAPAQVGDHIGGGAGDAEVDDPVREEAEGHTEGALGKRTLLVWAGSKNVWQS